MSEENPVCDHAESCEMYSLFRHAGTLGVFKLRYCQADFTTCARYQLSASGRTVPLRLMPNGQTLKKAIR